MKARKFLYKKPSTIQEALELLDKHGSRAKVVAGGTDLLVLMKERRVEMDYLIDLRKIQSLEGVRQENGSLVIGARCTHTFLSEDEVILKRLPILAQAAGTIGSRAIRNKGTVGGNLCNASPAADTAVALLALDAEVGLVSSQGRRLVALRDFLTGPNETILKANEIMEHLKVPVPGPEAKGNFQKLGLSTSGDGLYVVSVGVVLNLAAGNKMVKSAAIALGNVAPTAIRTSEAEAFLAGKTISLGVIEETGRLAKEATRPKEEYPFLTEEYRRNMTEVLVWRAINQCVAGTV